MKIFGWKTKITLLCGAMLFLIDNLSKVNECIHAYASTSFYCDESLNITGEEVDSTITLRANKNYGPSFTFLVHGIGSDAGAWANNKSMSLDSNGSLVAYGNGNFNLLSDSIINEINEKVSMNNGYSDVYVARPISSQPINYNVKNNYKFSLEKMELDGSSSFCDKIKDVTAHNIIVFESPDSFQGFDLEYYLFDRLADCLSYDFYKKMNFIPKINIVGQSRGGLVAQEYANKHSFNVDSIFTLGTPFSGSKVVNLINGLKKYKAFSIPSDFSTFFESQAFADAIDSDFSERIKNEWNNSVGAKYIDAYSVGSCMTISLLQNIIEKTPTDSYVGSCKEILLNVLDRINAVCSYDYDNNNVEAVLNEPIRYELANSCWKDVDGENSTRIQEEIAKILEDAVDECFRDTSDGEKFYSFCEDLESIPVSCPFIRFIAKLVQVVAISVKDCIISKKVASLQLASLFHSYNGKLGIVTNDLYIDIDSQMPKYNNYKKYLVVFSESILNNNQAKLTCNKAYPVGHNMETRTDAFVKFIKNNSEYASFSNININECYETNSEFVKENSCVVIKQTVRAFSMKSDSKYTIKNPHVVIENRTEPLDLILDNFYAVGGYSGPFETSPFIEYVGNSSFTLNIKYSGKNYFGYRDGHSRTFLNNTSAFKLPLVRVNLISDYSMDNCLIIKGANGASGANGEAGKTGTSGSKGSRGANGGNGANGANGCDGCDAIYCEFISLRAAKNLTLEGGNAGNGGDGGNGGKGGEGGTGAYCGIPFEGKLVEDKKSLDASVFLIVGNIGKGGRGGSGGDGGNGWNGSNADTHTEGALWWKKTVIDRIYYGGEGGNGGVVGLGGSAGFEDYHYSIYKYIYSFQYAYGGLCGIKYGNGGNGGNCGSYGIAGEKGYAVEDLDNPNKDIEKRKLFEYIDGKKVFALNGNDRSSDNKIKKSSQKPSVGRNGKNGVTN